jgi:hypothetical protein
MSFLRSNGTRRRPRVALALAIGGIVCLVVLTLTAGLWTPAIGRGLTCDEQVAASDAILIENFDPEYLLFERAAAIEKAGLASRVLVPGEASSDRDVPNPVSIGFVEVMARTAHLRHVTYIPVREREPIAFGVAYQVRSFLVKNGIRSVILISPGFRSRRSVLVNKAILGDVAVTVSCVPVFGQAATPATWARTWHGRQIVFEQFAKLQYYRFYVMPFSSFAEPDGQPATTGQELWLN